MLYVKSCSQNRRRFSLKEKIYSIANAFAYMAIVSNILFLILYILKSVFYGHGHIFKEEVVLILLASSYITYLTHKNIRLKSKIDTLEVSNIVQMESYKKPVILSDNIKKYKSLSSSYKKPEATSIYLFSKTAEYNED